MSHTAENAMFETHMSRVVSYTTTYRYVFETQQIIRGTTPKNAFYRVNFEKR